MVQTYYDYINILAFVNLCRYENKREIELKTLNNYRQQLIIEYNNYIKNNNIDEELLNMEFNKSETLLDNFLEQYQNYFVLNKESLHLKNNITYIQLILELEYKIREENELSNTLFMISDYPSLKSILNIHTMDELLLNYSQIEKKLEQTYTKLYTKEDSPKLRKEIKNLMDLKANFYIQLGLMPNYLLEAFRLSAGDIDYPNAEQFTYNKYPLNKDLWLKLPRYNDEYDYDIDNYAYNLYQYALFGKSQLYPTKIYEDIDNFQFKQNIDAEIKEQFYNGELEIETDDEIIDTDKCELESCECNTEQEIFYLNYINNLNYFLNTYGYTKDLITSKVRLMYVIDNPELRIYDDNNFQKAMESLSSIQSNSVDWDYLQNEVYFLIQELFLNPSNEFTIKKLLYIKTYYDVTQDSYLIHEITKYSQDNRYELFYSIVVNDNQLNKKTIEKRKKYFKNLENKTKEDK